MPEQTIQQVTSNPEPDEADTEAEFKSLYTDAKEGKDRLESLAKSEEEAGRPEIARVYREMSATVLGLVSDLTAASAEAILSLEDEVADLPDGGGADSSALLQEDADKYLSLFDQYLRLLDGLGGLVPAGSDGDKQREIFATLRRLTEGLIEYTRSIIIEPEPDEDDPESEEEEEDEDE